MTRMKRLYSKIVFIILFFAFPLSLYAKEQPAEKQPSATDAALTVVTIESAQTAEYRKDEKSGDDLLYLSGGVQLSVEKDGEKSVISADEVNYNRRTEVLHAIGNVSVVTGENDSVTANSLLLNTATMEGIFDNGRAVQASSDAVNLPSGSTLIVISNLFGKTAANTITFKSGTLTFCDDENPHWRIKASKIWLLPGGEFAFLNARIFVGEVPVLYLPAFYYPKDELLFHPVLGYRSREGYFFQTTTYLYGRKGKEEASDDDSASYFSFVNTGALKEQEREGLVLHNLDADFTGDTSHYAKIMADYYSNLGWSAGFDAALKPSDTYLTEFDFSYQLSKSTTIFETGTSKTTYVTSAPETIGELIQGESHSDRSYFLGYNSQFRYAANLKTTVAKPFTLSVSLPVYSDPYFKKDFQDRSETMDWIDFLMQGDTATSSSDDDTDSETGAITSFTWNITGSYKQTLPSAINPYLTDLSISSLTSSSVFTAVTNTAYTDSSYDTYDTTYMGTYSPERKFYYPSSVTPLKIAFSIAGTIYEYPPTSSNKNSSAKAPVFPVSLTAPSIISELNSSSSDTEKKGEEDDSETDTDESEPVDDGSETVDDGSETVDEDKEEKSEEELTEEEKQKKEEEAKKEAEAKAEQEKKEQEEKERAEKEAKDAEIEKETGLPKITLGNFSLASFAGWHYALTYAIKPVYTTQVTYATPKLPSEFDWNEYKSTYHHFTSPTTLTSALSYDTAYFTSTNSFTFTPVYQAHPYLNITGDSSTGYTEASAATVKTTDYNARKLDLQNDNSVSYKPLYYNPYFKNTGVTYTSTVKLIRTNFIGNADEPEWEYLTLDLSDDECVTVNKLTADLASQEGDFSQKLSLSSNLPPVTDEYTSTLTLGFPYTTLTASTGIKYNEDTEEWEKEDFKQSLTFSAFSSKLKLTESFNFDLEEWYKDSLQVSLTAWDFQAAYTMSYMYGSYMQYDNFGIAKGWAYYTEKEFLPKQLSLAYAKSKKTFRRWKNRISVAPSLSSSVVYDYQRPTSSYFLFVPSITFHVEDFFDITFSSESRNDSIYRYFQKYSNHDFELSGETNPVLDLIDSFRFDDEEKRRASGFKLKSLKMTITHDLHDWDISSTLTIKPRLLTDEATSRKYYDVSPYFTISVAWRPMGAMKTTVEDEYGEWTLNP